MLLQQLLSTISLNCSSLPKLIDCDKFSLIIISKDLIDYVETNDLIGICKEKFFYLQRWFSLLTKDPSTLSEPKFKTLPQLTSGLKSC